MKRRAFIILVCAVFLAALISTIFISCDNEDKLQCTDGLKHYTSDGKTQAPGEDMTEFVESELPPESFVGTVIEEDT